MARAVAADRPSVAREMIRRTVEGAIARIRAARRIDLPPQTETPGEQHPRDR
jgi:hypothetical protein